MTRHARRAGRWRPASAFKRRAVRNASGEIVKDPDTGKPVMRVIRPGLAIGDRRP